MDDSVSQALGRRKLQLNSVYITHNRLNILFDYSRNIQVNLQAV
jgi:hypothetical protein